MGTNLIGNNEKDREYGMKTMMLQRRQTAIREACHGEGYDEGVKIWVASHAGARS